MIEEPAAVAAAAEMLALTEAQAMHCCATHRAEIDAEVAQADAESRSAEAAWLAGQRKRPPS